MQLTLLKNSMSHNSNHCRNVAQNADIQLTALQE